ncbi:MAG: nicotinate (nicotinamide) nucleotide adenylyltransferase [Verrucomicrobia bacterium]|nr:nicotinate (nicotinamide) nucleotide adenylyltransferase [Verrucomicrobiota bacterium]
MAERRKSALFGGTFDPVHAGHLWMAAAARDALGLDEVRFLPCRLSPHKTGTPPTPAADRLEMLRLALAEIPWAVPDDFELRGAEVSYSYQTAEHFFRSSPATAWFWLMGGDQWRALPRWTHPERLAACVEFIVIARDGEPIEAREGFRMRLVPGEHPASATRIREAVGAGETDHPWLAPAVAAHIAERGLYRCRHGCGS